MSPFLQNPTIALAASENAGFFQNTAQLMSYNFIDLKWDAAEELHGKSDFCTENHISNAIVIQLHGQNT